MNSNVSMQEAILYALIHNQMHYKALAQPYMVQLNELLKAQDSSFHEEIRKQYKQHVTNAIANDITNALAIPLENVIIILEGVSMEEYLSI